MIRVHFGAGRTKASGESGQNLFSRYVMATQTVWSCRDTIQINDENQYPVKEAGAKACWEIVQEVDAFSFNVCSDCLVYVADQENSILSQKEIQDIISFKGLETLSGSHCHQFTNAIGK